MRQMSASCVFAFAFVVLCCAGCVAPPPSPPGGPPVAAATAAPGTATLAAVATPPQLQPPPPAAPLLRANAQGVQIYTCAAKQGGGFDWSFKAPEAVLFDAGGRPAVRHFAGPSWQANDGSIVVGEAVANVPSPNGQGVPWLLLRAKAHQGAGIFAGVTYIQRLDTNGGTAPALPCGPPNIGQEARIPYTAVYVLYQ